MNIYVGNIAYNMSDDELRSVFENFGDVDSARIITDRDTGRSKGFGFVEMPDDDQASAAVDALNGSDMMGRTLTVNEARPKSPAMITAVAVAVEEVVAAVTAVATGVGVEATTVTEPLRLHMIKAPCTVCMGLFCVKGKRRRDL